MAILSKQNQSLIDLTNTKGEEYSRTLDQLANFKRQADELGVGPITILMVYLNKHLDAIKHHARHGITLSEPIEGRIDDAILYLTLYKALVIEAREDDRAP
jgi:hypothetical protein